MGSSRKLEFEGVENINQHMFFCLFVLISGCLGEGAFPTPSSSYLGTTDVDTSIRLLQIHHHSFPSSIFVFFFNFLSFSIFFIFIKNKSQQSTKIT